MIETTTRNVIINQYISVISGKFIGVTTASVPKYIKIERKGKIYFINRGSDLSYDVHESTALIDLWCDIEEEEAHLHLGREIWFRDSEHVMPRMLKLIYINEDDEHPFIGLNDTGSVGCYRRISLTNSKGETSS